MWFPGNGADPTKQGILITMTRADIPIDGPIQLRRHEIEPPGDGEMVQLAEDLVLQQGGDVVEVEEGVCAVRYSWRHEPCFTVVWHALHDRGH